MRLEASIQEIMEESEEFAGIEYEDDYSFFGPPLCDPWIVKGMCKIMDLSKTNNKAVSITELSMVTSVNRPSILGFLKQIGFQSAGEEGGVEEVACLELCKAVVAAIPEAQRPPASDTACRSGSDGEPEVVCDIDVSPGELSEVDFDTDAHDFHTGHPANDSAKGPEPDDVFDGTDLSLDDATPSELLVRIANRFRIYPKLAIEVSADVGDVGLEDDSTGSAAELEEAVSLAQVNSTGSCVRMYCKRIADCDRFPTMCSGCRGCRVHASLPSAPSPAPAATTTSRPSSRPSWYADVEKVSVKAQAYVAKALQVAPQATSLMKRWFGRSDAATLAKVMKVLNSLSAMLGNVAYKKGPECGPHTYAYVYPYGPKSKNSKGEFVFFLCSVYFRSDEGEKIETLTHEGSHHAIAYTDDVWADAAHTRKAYGRSTCQQLARQYPDRAILNADSHCYFINDVNNHR